MWLLDFLHHRRVCKHKQAERSDRIRAWSTAHTIGLSSADRSILDSPIQDLVRHVQTGTTSPSNVVQAYAKAAIQAHLVTNCLTEVMFEQACEWTQDGSINFNGPLAGVPVSLKDTIIVGGFDASVGFSRKCFAPHVQDGPLVRLLKDAGAVPFVKTALPITLLSFESTNDLWGQCKNPHNSAYSPGGSSGGEGALLAYGGSRIGIGSDVAGSVRVPAHYSGCYSLRCSIGRWPKAGVDTSMPGQEGVPSVFSPMARTFPDLAYFTRSIVQMEPWNYDHSVHLLPWRADIEAHYLDSSTRLRIGIMRTDGVVYPSPACERALETTASALRAAGHSVFDITPPPTATPYEALVLGAQLLNADGTRTFTSFFSAGESSDPGASQLSFFMSLPSPIRWLYSLYARYILRDPIWAGLLCNLGPKTAAQNWALVARRERLRSAWFDWWNDLEHNKGGMDVLLAPPNATPAVPHGGMKDAIAACGYSFLFNVLDYTAGVLPVTHVDPVRDALSSEFTLARLNRVARGAYMHYNAVEMGGLPVGVQIVGRRLEEEKVLAVMQRVQDALEAHGTSYELLRPP